MKWLSSYHPKPIRIDTYVKSYAFIKRWSGEPWAEDPAKLEAANRYAAAMLDCERGRYDRIDRIAEEYVKARSWDGDWWKDKAKVSDVMCYLHGNPWKGVRA